MGKISIYSGGAAMSLLIGYAAAASVNSSQTSLWYLTVLFWAFIICGTIFVVTGIIYIVQKYGKYRKATHSKIKVQKQLQEFSIDWVDGNRDGYFFRLPNGGEYAYEANFEEKATALILDATLVINTSRTIVVESLELDIAGKSIPSDWKSKIIYKSTQINVCFDMPLDTIRGKRTIKLKAIIDGQEGIYGTYLKELPSRLLKDAKTQNNQT